MKILAINAGSSSLKFCLYEFPNQIKLISGCFEKIGFAASFYKIEIKNQKFRQTVVLKDHQTAVDCLIKALVNYGVIKELTEIDGVGHRIVQGADYFSHSVLVTDNVIQTIEQLGELAPLHNPIQAQVIRIFQSKLPHTPMVTVFDTAYHQTMKPEAYIYPVPYEWYQKYRVRRYGAHGTSHRYVNLKISQYLKRKDLKVISCHIGNGSSVTAIEGGKVVITSMGFTPLAGVMMGTRCGDIDVSLIPYVMKKAPLSITEIMTELNYKSGLLGISGYSSDNRDVEARAAENDPRSVLAQEMYSQRIADYIAMYYNRLNGADVIVMTAGLGEKASEMRRLIITKLTTLGLVLDEELNKVRGEFKLITKPESKIPVYVVPTDEELMIAEDTYELVK